MRGYHTNIYLRILIRVKSKSLYLPNEHKNPNKIERVRSGEFGLIFSIDID